MSPASAPPVVLASQSPARAQLLRAAGLSFETRPAYVDEEAIIAALQADGQAPREIADALGELKAERVSRQVPEALVVAGDQVLTCEGALYQKPETLEAARAQLTALRGRMHELIAAVCVARGGSVIWRHVDRAKLWVRDFSDAFLERYLAETGESVLTSVGCYRLEGPGVQLFERIEGDYFTVLGLPLLPVLGFLRQHGAMGE